ncbi:MAG: hypothetical protein ACI87V_001204, partial [Flavobacteriales bacterium]
EQFPKTQVIAGLMSGSKDALKSQEIQASDD